MKKFAFISQPMKGKEYHQVKMEREALEIKLKKMGYEVINSFVSSLVPTDVKNGPLCCLGNALIRMADADLVVFMKGWNHARGCKLEHHAAKAYGLNIAYERTL